MFWVFGHREYGTLAYRPGIKPTPPWAGGLSLHPWTTREILLFKNLTSLITHVFLFYFLTQKVVIVVLA